MKFDKMDDNENNEFINSNSALGKLIAEIRSIEKKPKLDNALSEILDEFLVKLKESEAFLANGICNINFSEAALLLQNSAQVYGKKVDILWDAVNDCQKRMVSMKLSPENGKELKNLEERQSKYKRKRTVIEQPVHKQNSINFHIDWDKIDNFEHGSFTRDEKIFSNWNGKNVLKNFNFDTTNFEKENFIETTRFKDESIHTDDQDNEFIARTSALESVKGLDNIILNPNGKIGDFHIELITELYLLPKFLSQNKLTYDDLEKHNIEFEKFVSNFRDHFNNFLKPELRQTPQKLKHVAPSPAGSEKVFTNCNVKLLRLSHDDMKRLRFSSEEMESHSNPLGVLEVAEIEKSSTDEIVNLPNNEVNNNDNALTVPTVEEKDENLQSQQQKFKKKKKECYETDPESNDESDEEIPLKRRKLSKKEMKKLATGITVDYKKFNNFLAANYVPEENEGCVDIELDDPLDSSSVLDPNEDYRDEISTNFTRNMSEDSGYESHAINSEDIDDSLSITEETCPENEETLEKNENSLFEWKQRMSTKLRSINSSDFDIREYCSKIIEHLDEEDGHEENFGDIVRGKSSSEVARFFMSTLHLANSSNVKIRGVQNGKLSNDTLNVKLIDKEWHFDKIEDYVPPSEVNYEERLKKSKRAFPGTSGYGQNSKRGRF